MVGLQCNNRNGRFYSKVFNMGNYIMLFWVGRRYAVLILLVLRIIQEVPNKLRQARFSAGSCYNVTNRRNIYLNKFSCVKSGQVWKELESVRNNLILLLKHYSLTSWCVEFSVLDSSHIRRYGLFHESNQKPQWYLEFYTLRQILMKTGAVWDLVL